MAAGVVAFWKEWGVLVLVQLSFVLQVILLITAEIRRRKDSGVLKVVVWLAYVMADTTAVYVLGHMSVTITTSKEHQLAAFWAPFLLLHLGGQDNITAYAIEDNRLWLRHLQSFVVQVLAAAYVLYQSSVVARRTFPHLASILMFVVGVLKYGERVCALKLACSGSNLSGKNYRSSDSKSRAKPTRDNRVRSAEKYLEVFLQHDKLKTIRAEALLQTIQAHALLDIAKNLLNGSSRFPLQASVQREWEGMYQVAEMQLLLMHDVLYSKSELIHTWYGYCIRVASLPAMVAALLLFSLFSEKDGYRRRADVATTYVLLAGAAVLEITSMLRATCSTWSYYKLVAGRPYRYPIARALRSRLALWFVQLVRYTRYWSGSMGQHNFIDMSRHCKGSRGTKIARWIGYEDWWNMLVYTSSIRVSPDLTKLLKKQMQMQASKKVDRENPDHIGNSRGRVALKRWPRLYKELGWSLNTDLDEIILVWHIATHSYLSWYKAEHAGRPHQLAQVTQELSNYLMFLLAARPYVLPDGTSRERYVQLCYQVVYGFGYDLLTLKREYYRNVDRVQRKYLETHSRNESFDRGCLLGSKLITKALETPDADMLELISQVWMELLCYTAYRCKPDSHARQLSNGGEFTTVVALMLEYTRRGYVNFPTEVEPQHEQGRSGSFADDSTTASSDCELDDVEVDYPEDEDFEEKAPTQGGLVDYRLDINEQPSVDP